MPRIPNFTQGTFNEALWRQAGDVDECGPMSDMICVHSVAGWENLPGVTAYRAAAGDPDDGNADGFTIGESLKAIKALWPKIGALCKPVNGGSWATVEAAIKAKHPVDLSVLAGLLPWHGTFVKGHRIAVYESNVLRAVDPLKKAHSIGIETTMAVLKKAAEGYDSGKIWAIIFPTVDEAFMTHPLLAGVVKTAVDKALAAAPAVDTEAAELAGAQAEWDRQKAGATVALLPRP